jgi:DNA topoisomerase-1
LLETTFIRVGNEEYVRQNKSFGLTTLRNKHARIRKDEIHFEFRGKSGIQHCVTVYDRRLARIVKQCREIPGQELFQYLDEDGQRRPIGSVDVNEYLQAITGGEFTAKDFRTWAGTLLAARAFHDLPADASETQNKRNVVQAIENVARQLGNTVAVCRKCYIHPGIIDSYLAGSLAQSLNLPATPSPNHSKPNLAPDEAALLRWLRKELAR